MRLGRLTTLGTVSSVTKSTDRHLCMSQYGASDGGVTRARVWARFRSSFCSVFSLLLFSEGDVFFSLWSMNLYSWISRHQFGVADRISD